MIAATDRMVAWLRCEPQAVEELAGAATGYGGAFDQSVGAMVGRISGCVETMCSLPTDPRARPPISRSELTLVDWRQVLDALVRASTELLD